MSAWRVAQTYGFGAGRLAVAAEPFHPGDPDDSVRRAARVFVHDVRQDGLRRVLTYSGSPALGLALVALLAIATFLVRQAEDDSDIQLIPFAELPPPLVEPERLPEPAPPVPAPVAKPAPPPPEVVPPPAPVPKPPATPEPIAIARPAPPPQPLVRPPPPPKPPPRVRPEPAERARPRVQIDRLAAAPKPVAEPLPSARRAPRPTSDAARPRVAVAPLSAPKPAAQATPELPSRAFRVARAQRPGPKPLVSVDPVPARVADRADPDVPEPSRRLAPAPEPTRARTAPRPDLRPAAANPVLPSGPAAPRSRTQRAAPAPRDASPNRLAVSAVAVPGLASPRPTTSAAAPVPQRVARAVPDGAAPGPRRSEQEGRLSGVPLGSLAACRSDAEEDALKQAVVAAVTTQNECLSEAGHYRFLQTRNLNSFLMWVDRAPGRGEADRCVELRYALDCLKRRARTGSRSG